MFFNTYTSITEFPWQDLNIIPKSTVRFQLCRMMKIDAEIGEKRDFFKQRHAKLIKQKQKKGMEVKEGIKKERENVFLESQTSHVSPANGA